MGATSCRIPFCEERIYIAHRQVSQPVRLLPEMLLCTNAGLVPTYANLPDTKRHLPSGGKYAKRIHRSLCTLGNLCADTE